MKKAKRQLLEVNGLVSTTIYLREYNTLQKVSRAPLEFIKCPVNIGDSKASWKDFKLYVKYLDMKVQNPDIGTFQIFHSHRYYQRTIKQLIQKGWATREGKKVFLKAYQHVWRDMGVNRVNDKGFLRFKYWKIPVSLFSEERKIYLKEIEHEIRKRISKRKLAQIRYALKANGETVDEATFSAKSASSLFGYRSPTTGSKLRTKYFEVIPEDSKPKYNIAHGRYEEPTKKIAL